MQAVIWIIYKPKNCYSLKLVGVKKVKRKLICATTFLLYRLLIIIVTCWNTGVSVEANLLTYIKLPMLFNQISSLMLISDHSLFLLFCELLIFGDFQNLCTTRFSHVYSILIKRMLISLCHLECMFSMAGIILVGLLAYVVNVRFRWTLM